MSCIASDTKQSRPTHVRSDEMTRLLSGGGLAQGASSVLQAAGEISTSKVNTSARVPHISDLRSLMWANQLPRKSSASLPYALRNAVRIFITN
eukprot:918876-Amphidinium_carterae.1